MSARAAFALSLAALVIGCVGGGELPPLPSRADAGSEADAGVADAGVCNDGGPCPGPVKRTVSVRNPFGGPAGNLLVDGDIEMSTTNDQYGDVEQTGVTLFATDGSTQLPIKTETGGLCRSGLRCAVFQPGTIMLLRGAAANGVGNEASVWAKPPDGSTCAVVKAVMIGCDTFAVLASLANASQGTDGWCQYKTTSPMAPSKLSVCMYVENTLPAGTSALVDNAVLSPADGTVPFAATFLTTSPETTARLAKLRETVRKNMRFGRTPRRPPPPAR